MTVFIYGRVSTNKQAQTGSSIQEQITRLQEQASVIYPEHQAHSFIDLGVSGGISLDGRPNGKEMLAVVKSGDIILTTKLDRLFRDSIDGLLVGKEMLEIGVLIHPLDMGPIRLDTAIGYMQYTQALAMAQYELDTTKERTAKVRSHQQHSNAYTGGYVPIGREVIEEAGKRMLVESEDKDEIHDLINQYRHNDHKSYREIEVILREKHQIHISYRSIQRILTKPGG